MDPSTDVFDAVLNPTAVYTPLLEWDEDKIVIHTDEADPSPHTAPNLMGNSMPNHHSTWRLDAVDADGARFFAIPIFALGRPPLRIDVVIPSQTEHSFCLRRQLQSGSAMLLKGRQVINLAISQHVLRAVELWSSQISDFQSRYLELPFGSRIVVENIAKDVRDMMVHMIPIYDLEQLWCSAEKLKGMWNMVSETWPAPVDLSDLSMEQQLSEAISLVKIPTRHSNSIFVFKSAIRDPKYMYHELKMLLTMESHASIVPRPLYVVTKKSRFGGKVGICGFILKYYPLGTLQRALEESEMSTTIIHNQIRWARQVTEALIHIYASPMGYYPDIKPDNVCLSLEDGALNAILIDLEQRGGWFSWSPPEVLYIEMIEYLAVRATDRSVREEYTVLLRRHIPTWKAPRETDKYQNNQQGFSSAWVSLPAAKREAGQVFMLGKLLWCIFERMPSINTGLFVEMFREVKSERVFPEFHKTPRQLRPLIRACTAGAPEWKGRSRNIEICDGRLVATEPIEERSTARGSARETQLAAKKWWAEELKVATAFLNAKIEEDAGGDQHGNNKTSLAAEIGQRPSLHNVLKTLKQFPVDN